MEDDKKEHKILGKIIISIREDTKAESETMIKGPISIIISAIAELELVKHSLINIIDGHREVEKVIISEPVKKKDE